MINYVRITNSALFVAIYEAVFNCCWIALTGYAARGSRLVGLQGKEFRTGTRDIAAVAPSVGSVTILYDASVERIEIHRFLHHPGFSFRNLFQYAESSVPQILYPMEQHALTCAADGAFAMGIAQKKPLIM